MRDELLLYDLTDSPFCAKVRMALQWKGLAYRRITASLGKRRELRRVNPLGKVPVLIDRGRPIPDSTAILEYLEREHPTPPLLPPDPAARAFAALVEDWADEALSLVGGALKWLDPATRGAALERTLPELGGGMLTPLLGRVIVRRVRRRYRALGLPPTAAHFADGFRAQLGWLGQLLAGRDFLLGRTVTLADLAVYAQLAWMRPYGGAALLATQPGIEAWIERLEGMPAIGDPFAAG